MVLPREGSMDLHAGVTVPHAGSMVLLAENTGLPGEQDSKIIDLHGTEIPDTTAGGVGRIALMGIEGDLVGEDLGRDGTENEVNLQNDAVQPLISLVSFQLTRGLDD